MTNATREEVGERELAPEGRWRGKVVDHDIGEAETGAVQCAIQFLFKDDAGKDWRATKRVYFTEKTLAEPKSLAEPLRALGFDIDADGNLNDISPLARKSAENPKGGALMGKEADIVVEHVVSEQGKSKGKKFAQVAWVNPPGGGLGIKKAAEGAEGIKSLSQRVRALAGSGAGPVPASGASKASSAASGAKPDLPF